MKQYKYTYGSFSACQSADDFANGLTSGWGRYGWQVVGMKFNDDAERITVYFMKEVDPLMAECAADAILSESAAAAAACAALEIRG